MNERIKTLIKESGGHNIAYEGRPGSYSYAFTDNSVEKFAELILFECVKIAVFKGDTETAKEIKSHFGLR